MPRKTSVHQWRVMVCGMHGSVLRVFSWRFAGRMVVFMGGKASGFKNVHDHDTYDADGTRLFQVRGVCEVDTRAIQRPEAASSLNSDDVFVLETPSATFLWTGTVSSYKTERTYLSFFGGTHVALKTTCPYVTLFTHDLAHT